MKTKNIINWVLTALIGLLFIWSAYSKLWPTAEILKMTVPMGIDATILRCIGITEIASVILFIIPRTGVLGTLLLAAYMGGAIATHIEHNLPFALPVVIAAFIWIVAVMRFPELTKRILGKPNQ